MSSAFDCAVAGGVSFYALYRVFSKTEEYKSFKVSKKWIHLAIHCPVSRAPSVKKIIEQTNVGSIGPYKNSIVYYPIIEKYKVEQMQTVETGEKKAVQVEVEEEKEKIETFCKFEDLEDLIQKIIKFEISYSIFPVIYPPKAKL
jgi:hypothetical protein